MTPNVQTRALLESMERTLEFSKKTHSETPIVSVPHECMDKLLSYIRILEGGREALEHVTTVIDWHPSFNVMGEDATKRFEGDQPLVDVTDIADKALQKQDKEISDLFSPESICKQ